MRLGGVVHRRDHVLENRLVFSYRLGGRRFRILNRPLWRWRRGNRVGIEARSLQFVADKPRAQYARDLVIIEDIGVDRINRHDRATGSQDDKVARL